MRILKKSIALIVPLLLASCTKPGQQNPISSSAPNMDMTDAECFIVLSDDAMAIAVPNKTGTIVVDNSVKENDAIASDHTFVTMDSERKIAALYSTFKGGPRISDCYCKVVASNDTYVEYSNSIFYPYHTSYVDDIFYRHLLTLYSNMRVNMSEYDGYSDFINGIGFLISSNSLEEFLETTEDTFVSNFYYFSSERPKEEGIETKYQFVREGQEIYSFHYSISYSTEYYTAVMKMDILFNCGNIMEYSFQYGNSTHLAGTFSNNKRIISSTFKTSPDFAQEDYDSVKVEGFFAPTKKMERDLNVYLDGSTEYLDSEGNTKTFSATPSLPYGTDLHEDLIPDLLPVLNREVKSNCTLDSLCFFDSSQTMEVPDDYSTSSWRDVNLYFRSKPNPGYCAVLINYYRYNVASFEPLYYSNNNMIMRSDIHILPISNLTYEIPEYSPSYINANIQLHGRENESVINLVDQAYLIVDATALPRKLSDRYR